MALWWATALVECPNGVGKNPDVHQNGPLAHTISWVRIGETLVLATFGGRAIAANSIDNAQPDAHCCQDKLRS